MTLTVVNYKGVVHLKIANSYETERIYTMLRGWQSSCLNQILLSERMQRTPGQLKLMGSMFKYFFALKNLESLQNSVYTSFKMYWFISKHSFADDFSCLDQCRIAGLCCANGPNMFENLRILADLRCSQALKGVDRRTMEPHEIAPTQQSYLTLPK